MRGSDCRAVAGGFYWVVATSSSWLGKHAGQAILLSNVPHSLQHVHLTLFMRAHPWAAAPSAVSFCTSLAIC